MAAQEKRNRMKNRIESRAGEREGRKRPMALEVGLKGEGKRGSPWETDTRESKEGRGVESGGGREGGDLSSPLRLADTKLTEQDNNNQDLDNNKASHYWFQL